MKYKGYATSFVNKPSPRVPSLFMEKTAHHSGTNKAENTLSIALRDAMSLLPLLEIAAWTLRGQGVIAARRTEYSKAIVDRLGR